MLGMGGLSLGVSANSFLARLAAAPARRGPQRCCWPTQHTCCCTRIFPACVSFVPQHTNPVLEERCFVNFDQTLTPQSSNPCILIRKLQASGKQAFRGGHAGQSPNLRLSKPPLVSAVASFVQRQGQVRGKQTISSAAPSRAAAHVRLRACMPNPSAKCSP